MKTETITLNELYDRYKAQDRSARPNQITHSPRARKQTDPFALPSS